MKSWTINDAIVQIDAAMSGLRAGLGGVVVSIVNDRIRIVGHGHGLHLLRVVASQYGHEILVGDGDGHGDGYSSGDGYGSGYGSGDSYGYGSGDGDGAGGPR